MNQVLLDNIALAQIYALFVNKPGQRVRMVYYTGVVTGNPSGSVNNVQHIYYETLDQSGKWNQSLLKELTYDANNNMLTTTVLGN